MTEDLDSRYRHVLARQLEMNKETWRSLQSHGVTEQTDLRLDFSYVAPNESSANKLREIIQDQTDYAVEVQAEGALFRRTWIVVGSTQPTKVSPAVLDQWVDWMVTAGLHQGCEFDGWGTELPT
ncbi:MAG TPA: ribonuclease E inhibitor RraB [Gemmatimonadaceae bacterium]|nr:ribonuclease E inhibitor RraB [Gemmatimonadaceae bacterium]